MDLQKCIKIQKVGRENKKSFNSSVFLREGKMCCLIKKIFEISFQISERGLGAAWKAQLNHFRTNKNDFSM